MTNEEFAAIIRSMIEHENQLINHRLTWLAAFQGFLVAAVGFAASEAKLDGTILVYLICALGFVIALSTAKTLWASQRAIKSLLEQWNERLAGNPVHDGPRVIGSPGPSALQWMKPWYVFPWAMMVFWVVLAGVKLLGELGALPAE